MEQSVDKKKYTRQVHDQIKKTLSWQTECNVAITGFLPEKMPEYLDVLELQRVLKMYFAVCYFAGYRNFLCGLAQGTDLWAAKMVAELKHQHDDIGLYTFQPCEDQTKGWKQHWKQKHREIVEKVANENFVLQREYSPTCMQERNQAMVRNASCLIAVYDHNQFGGTKNIIEYARKHPRDGYDLIVIDPRKYVDRRMSMNPNSPWREPWRKMMDYQREDL